MKILIVNTYHYLRGGDCRHAFGAGELLSKEGHQIHYFSMNCDENYPCEDQSFFVSEIDFRKAFDKGGPLTAIKVLGRSIFSREAARNLERLLTAIKPDIAHLHSIRHHLTKSILPVFKKHNIPVVWTLHDFKELCPNTSFFDGEKICEKCLNDSFFPVIWNRCKKKSFGASIIAWAEAIFNKQKAFDDCVDTYIAPSQFLRSKFISCGYDPEKIVHLPNFLDIDIFSPSYDHTDYILFIGRLEPGKGLETLLLAFGNAKKTCPSLKLKIAGTGTLQRELDRLIKNKKIDGVEFMGFLGGEMLENLIQRAKAVVIPSELYENYPFSGLEAMAYGKPIIGSRIGGIPEQVEEGVTGYLFTPFDHQELSEKIELVNQLPPDKIREMGQQARYKVEKTNRPERYLEMIEPIYKNLVQKK